MRLKPLFRALVLGGAALSGAQCGAENADPQNGTGGGGGTVSASGGGGGTASASGGGGSTHGTGGGAIGPGGNGGRGGIGGW
jgi:hypothetical protein